MPTTPIRAARAAALTLAATLAATAAAQAAPVTIDFDSDIAPPPNFVAVDNTGFQSDDSSIVTFSSGGSMQLGTYTEINNDCPPFPQPCAFDDVGLAIGIQDTSLAIMEFSQLVTGLSLNFYNDESAFGLARLRGFRDGALIATATETVDGDESSEQTVSLGATVIDRADFTFTNEFGAETVAQSKIIDNVTFEPDALPGPAPIPVPMALPLLASAFGLVGALRATRRRAEAYSLRDEATPPDLR